MNASFSFQPLSRTPFNILHLLKLDAETPPQPPDDAKKSADSKGKRSRRKLKKPRTSFTRVQVAILEQRFIEQKYLASSDRQLLAAHLQMSDAQVKTWFQNRRTKWRRQEATIQAAQQMVSAAALQTLNFENLPDN